MIQSDARFYNRNMVLHLKISLVIFYCFFATLSILTALPTRGQIRFQLQWHNWLDNTTRIDSGDYTLMSLPDSQYIQPVAHAASVILPHSGPYSIAREMMPPLAIIHVPDTSWYTLTLPEGRIVECMYGMHGERRFETNGQRINGYLDDFYPNGHVRIRGNFTDGKPKDSLVYFHGNGQTKRLLRYQKTNVLIREYDSLGHLLQVSRNKRTFYLTDYRTIIYYPSGRLQLVSSRKNQVQRIRAYYPDGQLLTRQKPRKRATYFPTGKLQSAIKWTRKRAPRIAGDAQFEFVVTEKTYDSSGRLVRKLIYEEWTGYSRQPNLGIRHADWIISYETYIDGQRRTIARDISPEKLTDIESED